MRLPDLFRLVVVFTILGIGQQFVQAETLRVKAMKSQDKRLSRELYLLQNCEADAEYEGVCRCGKALLTVKSEQKASVNMMSMTMKEVPVINERVSKRLLLSYDNDVAKPSEEILGEAGLEIVEDYEPGSFLIVQPVRKMTANTVKTLLRDDAVLHAAPDYLLSVPRAEVAEMVAASASSTSSKDPLFGQLWGLKNSGATVAWNKIQQSPNIIVAVIDTGVDYRHPDLRDNMWTYQGSHGYDFYDNDNDPMDEQNHGTHCAGTIAGAANNGVGVVGVSWKTQIMALRFLGPDGSGSTSDGVHCIDWAVEHGAHILSNSWSGPETSRELSEAVARAEKRGVLFVAAAGNTANGGNDNDVAPNYPASLPYPNIISVGAIDVNDARGSFSHYGKKTVDIGAPGVGIVSTVRAGEYAKYDGTSMATPHVAGAAALIWAKTFSQPAQDPNQMQTVRDLIYENARPVPALAEFWGHNAPARVKGGVLDISFLAQADNDNLPPSPGPTETTNPPIAANPTNPVINPNSTPTIASSQFGSGKVSIRTSGTISATKIVLKQPSVVHITANTSVASQNGGTRFTTGFSNQEPSDKIWLESARYIQVRSPGEWVNFGSTVSVNLPAGEHTIRWKIWRESSQSAELKFDSGSMLIQAYPVSAPPQTARSTSMSTSKKPVEAAIKIMDRPNNSSQRNR